MPLFPEVNLPRLTGQVLADVVHRKSVSAGGFASGAGVDQAAYYFLPIVGWGSMLSANVC